MTVFFTLLLSCTTAYFANAFCTQAEMDLDNLKKLATANNDFALNIHRQLASRSSDNIFFSPLSLSTAFGMLYYGAKGFTAEELRRLLGYKTADLEESLVHQTFQQYLTESLPSKDRSAYVLNSANAVLLDKHLDLVPSYKTEIQNLYRASVQDVDFLTHGPQIVQDINTWVKDKTEGKIDKLLDELDPSSAVVLLNAVYFKGTWETQFESSKTKEEIFYNYGLESGAKKVPTMKLTQKFPYATILDNQFLEMPYKGGNISMLVMLPNSENGLESLEKTLTLNKLAAIRSQLKKTKVHLSIPKFKIQYEKEMSADIKSLGASWSIFTPEADFSGISSSGNIFVSQVLHKAVIEVNEEGSEAAAVTGIISNRMRPIFDLTPHFIVDHPFLFAIVDNRNDMILFLGRVTNL